MFQKNQGRIFKPVNRVPVPVNFEKGAVKVVKNARGEPLHSTEIWSRMKSIGVRSNAKAPVGIVDFNLRKHPEDIEKAAPRTWKWIGALNGHGVPQSNNKE
jgi:hypothetical protein